MPTIWGPSVWGRRFTRSGDWQLSLDDSGLTVSVADSLLRARIDGLGSPTVRMGPFWSIVDLQLDGRRVVLQGIPNRSARGLALAFETTLARHVETVRVARVRTSFDQTAADVEAWAAAFFDAARTHLAAKGWLTREFRLRWETRKPAGDFDELLNEASIAEHIEAQNGAVLEAIDLWKAGLGGYIAAWNEGHLEKELEACRDFFNRVERSPLTDEQARAVVCFDNRVQVVASAGSGKTSTMVAKAAYALHRNLVPAEKILLLAFNTDAARELQQRIHDRLLPLGLDGGNVAAQTFHAFGLAVIGRATGRKPALAPWLDSGQDSEQLMRIVDELKDADPIFRTRWDLFRIVLGRDLPAFGQEEDDPEDWDQGSKSTGFQTLQGEVVKSQGERMIADWLFYNGVRYTYETRYEHDTTDATHRQYSPDFHYPDINVYHEHFALDKGGLPPSEFHGYLDGVIWKRATHQRYGTTLLETTMAGLWDGTAFVHLAKELTARGIVLDPNPDRPVHGRQPIENGQLVRTFRTFLIHAKSNQLDDDQLRMRLNAQPGTKFRFRHGMFLSLFAVIRKKWDEKLAAENFIDFEDMLNVAADHLESGRWDSGYELVMVDEMQDASHARARLARALVNRPGRHLFAVGDDWQSINRFAGADLSVMTDFDRWFGDGETLRLERTFRSPQSICDISSAFIQKNPAQLAKQVTSSAPEFTPTMKAISVGHADQFASVLQDHLEELNRGVQSGAIPAGAGGKVQVRILGRYRNLLNRVSDGCRQARGHGNNWERLNVGFQTIHGSKGLEADFIVILGMNTGAYGFPSTINDDPVLRLAMPEGDAFPLAEERRLFYVAMTRAKRSVLLLTIRNKESPFLMELVKDHNLTVHSAEGKALSTTICPECNEGFMVQRTARYGPFFGCSRFPKSRHTMKLSRVKNFPDGDNDLPGR
jgi:DNA helicase IV